MKDALTICEGCFSDTFLCPISNQIQMPTFILNDQNVKNSYGFTIPTNGINLKRFKANPVMLDQHYNSTSAVLGRWTNISVNDKGQLTADDEFDVADENAAKVKGKVDRGFIKGASMGVTFNRDKMKQQPNGSWELTECEIYEASIVAVPSNANALRLYAADTGELLTEDQVKLELSALSLSTTKITTNNMEKIILSAATLVALGLQNADNVNEVNTAIEKLASDNKKLSSDYNALKLQVESEKKEAAKAMLDNAQLEGKITADERKEYEELALVNPSLCTKMLAKLPGKTTLAGGVENKGASNVEVKTLEDFQKLNLDKQLAFKNGNPTAYQALFDQ